MPRSQIVSVDSVPVIIPYKVMNLDCLIWYIVRITVRQVFGSEVYIMSVHYLVQDKERKAVMRKLRWEENTANLGN